jgi:hypothetical protein
MRFLVLAGVAALALSSCRKPAPKPDTSAAPAPSAPAQTTPRGEVSPPLTIDSRTCGVETRRLSGARAGALRLGMPADSVRQLCRVVRDTLESQEGEKVRRIVVAVEGDTLRVPVVEGRVHSIVVESRHFMTSDSVRVGMPLSRLLAYPGLTGAYGEGDFYVFSDAPPVCGLSFRIDFGQRGQPFIRNPSRESLEPYGASARIEAILVRRCGR